MRRHLWPTDIPEIAALPPGRRMGAWRFLQYRLLGHWESWLGLVACAAIAAEPSSEPLLARGPLPRDSLKDSSDSIALRGPNVEVSGGHWAVRSTEGLG